MSGWNKRLLLLLVVTLLGGCASIKPPRPGDSSEFRPTPPPTPKPAIANAGAIYQSMHAQGLFEDYKARQVGDLLTVLLEEKTDAKKSAKTSTAKDDEIAVDVGNITLLGDPFISSATPLIGAAATGGRKFSGTGDSAQSNQLRGEITVTVAEVLANGNLVVQGEKWLGINQGKEFVRMRGIVRRVDIGADNTVSSNKVANAELYYGGTGALRDSNAQGWLSRFFNSPLFPI